MREITVRRVLDAPATAVWGVLADFPNIARWNSGVTESHATSADVEGVGASRHCDLSPVGALEETVVGWIPNERLVVRIDSAATLPIKAGEVTFSLRPAESGTDTEIRYAYRPKYGVAGSAMGPILDAQLRKGFTGFLDDLEAAAHEAAT